MTTSTPRTDATVTGNSSPTQDEYENLADFARTLERELYESRNAERLARVQLGAEREKVRVLQEAMKFLANKDMYFQVKFDPCQRASAALAATKDKA